MLDLAVIIVSWNVRDYLADCLRSVYTDLDRCDLRGEVWVIDNNSTDGTQELLRDVFTNTQLIVNEDNPGFGAANNQGMSAAASTDHQGPRYFLLLNPDTLVRPGALGHLVGSMDALPEAGLAGARLIYADGRFQQSAFRFPGLAQLTFDLYPLPDRLYESRLNGRYPRRRSKPNSSPFPVDHTLGAAMMVRSDVAEATGGFDESFHMYCEEIDWCWRIRSAGWAVYSVPKAEIVHFGGLSTRQIPARSVVNLWRSRAHLYRRHHGRLKFALARRLVKAGMNRKAAKASSQDLQTAYREAAAIWQNSVRP
ncbi:MAG: glycosyltransferase [Chloroflexota bacterium]|nr:MAG: glycosyltransferase [Chloroflexota bacterium]